MLHSRFKAVCCIGLFFFVFCALVDLFEKKKVNRWLLV